MTYEIETPDELDTLKHDSYVRDATGEHFYNTSYGDLWTTTGGYGETTMSDFMKFPITVLYSAP